MDRALSPVTKDILQAVTHGESARNTGFSGLSMNIPLSGACHDVEAEYCVHF